MAFVPPKDRVIEQSTSNSQTVFTVTGALDTSYNAFSASMSIGDTTIGAVVEAGTAFKSGILTYSNTNEVTVTTAIESKGTFSSGGTKQVFMGLPAARALMFDGAQSLTPAQQAQGRANIGVTKKNYLLNGGMQISQENGTTAGTTSGFYPADQWFTTFNSMGTGTLSVGQVASVTPGGSTHRLRATVTAAQATVGSSSVYIAQKIEGLRCVDLLAGSASAKTVTLQLGVKTAVSGTYLCRVTNAADSSSVSGAFTVAGGEINTDVVKSVTLALPTSGTWATDNTTGIFVAVYLMTSSQTANLLATNGNVLELFDVGLYEGAAPSFQLPDFASELSSCQRYWEKSYDYAVAPGSVSTNGCEGLSVGGPAGFTTMALFPRYGVRKRTAPTVAVYSETTGASNKVRDRVNSVDVTPTAIDLVGEKGFRTYATLTSSTVVSISCHWTANARM